MELLYVWVERMFLLLVWKGRKQESGINLCDTEQRKVCRVTLLSFVFTPLRHGQPQLAVFPNVHTRA